MSRLRRLGASLGPPLVVLLFLALAALPWAAARGQTAAVADTTFRIDVRHGASPSHALAASDTLWLNPGDTIPLAATLVDAAGRKVARATLNFWYIKSQCVAPLSRAVPRGAHVATFLVNSAEGCAPAGAVGISAHVDGREIERLLPVARPAFEPGSPLAICLSGAPRALAYAGTPALAMAIQLADGSYSSTTWAEEDSTADGATRSGLVRWPWQGVSTTVTLRYRAYRCEPGYVARDVTTSRLTRWVTDTSVATVRAGLVTWKRAAPLVVHAIYGQ